MSNYGNPPSDPYGQDPPVPGAPPQNPYSQPAQDGYGQNPYAQPTPQGGYGQNPYGGQLPLGQPGYAGAPVFAHWGQRVLARLIDGVLSALAMSLLFVGLIVFVTTTSTTYDPATEQYTSEPSGSGLSLALMGLGLLMGLAFQIWNSYIKQGTTGYSIGKGIIGIKLVKAETGQPIGAGLAFVRNLVHVVDGLPCYVGWFWPLWDAQRQTFADKIMGTYVIDQPKG